MNIQFGPAGIPIQCKKRTTIDGVRCCAELGLGAMEIQFGMGVRLSKDRAKETAKQAKLSKIILSSHAPYFVNFCSKEKKKISISTRNLFEAANITQFTGGKITVFHPGFYQNSPPEEAFKRAKKHLKELEEMLTQHGINIVLGAETVGKKSAFGGLMENIRLSQQLNMVQPVLDFAHILARDNVQMKTSEDYKKIMDVVEKELPDYGNNIHCHFSGINYTEKGERNHLPLDETDEPPYKPFMEMLAENGYKGTVICESPKLDIDAQKMKKVYLHYSTKG